LSPTTALFVLDIFLNRISYLSPSWLWPWFSFLCFPCSSPFIGDRVLKTFGRDWSWTPNLTPQLARITDVSNMPDYMSIFVIILNLSHFSIFLKTT
jgi:hypothetical protein